MKSPCSVAFVLFSAAALGLFGDEPYAVAIRAQKLGLGAPVPPTDRKLQDLSPVNDDLRRIRTTGTIIDYQADETDPNYLNQTLKDGPTTMLLSIPCTDRESVDRLIGSRVSVVGTFQAQDLPDAAGSPVTRKAAGVGSDDRRLAKAEPDDPGGRRSHRPRQALQAQHARTAHGLPRHGLRAPRDRSVQRHPRDGDAGPLRIGDERPAVRQPPGVALGDRPSRIGLGRLHTPPSTASSSRSAARKLLRKQSEVIRARFRTAERTRLATELHDSVVQNLTGAALEIRAAKAALPPTATDVDRHMEIALVYNFT